MKIKKNKIGFLIISPNWAGTENALKNIVKSLSKIKVKSVIYCNNEIYNYYNSIKNVQVYNLGIMNFDSKFRYLNYISMYKVFRKSLLSEEPLILFLMLDVPLFIACNINKKYKFPIIINLRGEEIDNFLNNKNNLTGFFLKRWLKKSPKIISVSQHQIQNLPEKYKNKTIVIPNGVDSKFFKSLKNIKQQKNIILFVGRIKKEKGINEILNISKQLPQYEFWFAGQGPLESVIKGKNVKNFGFKNKKELIKLYNQATICIQPSYREGFSNVGLETISCGRALICTPPFSEYIENGKDGIIIPAKDERALKEAIVDLMENPKKRERIEKNARKKALRYSWDKVAKMYLRVFKRLKNNNKNKIYNNGGSEIFK